jgi:hypothetical protein
VKPLASWFHDTERRPCQIHLPDHALNTNEAVTAIPLGRT